MAAGDISRGLKLRVRLRTGDMAGTVYTDREVYALLSEAIRDIVSRVPDVAVPAYCRVQLYTSTGETEYFDLPPDFLRERGLVWVPDGVWDKRAWATRISIEQIAAKLEVWEPSDKEPYYYIWANRVYLMTGGVHAGDEFRLYYVQRPDDYCAVLSGGEEIFAAEGTGSISDSVDPLLPRCFWRAMVDYAVARCLESRGAWDRARVLLEDYETGLREVVARYVLPGLPADQVPGEGIGLARTG